jgi:ribosomal protein L37AE/L43A
VPSHKRKLTFDCPVCKAVDEVVADPHSGTWICFNCRNIGTFTVRLIPAEGASFTEVGKGAPDAA